MNAPANDMLLRKRLQHYPDDVLKATGLRWLLRHSWYLTPEMATVVIFSDAITDEQKRALLVNMTSERGPHLLKTLPGSLEELQLSSSFFVTVGICDSFIEVPVEQWANDPTYLEALKVVSNIPSVNDCAERGVALIQEFNETSKDESQKQCLLQVVEKHRKEFGSTSSDLEKA